ncbi:MAG TPA: glycosyltransferase family 39 protein, partial [Pirellulales bacterium]|nr:glycosyltransferase family 39 protein [Pirellulales bacterium]
SLAPPYAIIVGARATGTLRISELTGWRFLDSMLSAGMLSLHFFMMRNSAFNTRNVVTPCWLPAALAVVCLLPRAALAVKLDALCNDAVFYINLAQGFEQGNLNAGLGRMGLNTYPPILAALHQFGLGWEAAGKWWGVFAAALAVMPLYGWVRRQFDDRTALVAGLLYAFHPKLIEWSPELLRDPTFWLLCGTSLYCSWRAADERQVGWYLTAGISIALAVHTRFEGWFLYLPLVGWTACGVRAACPRSRKLAGLLLALAMCPTLIVLVNATALRQHDRWELGNFDRLQYVMLWWKAAWGPERVADGTIVSGTDAGETPTLGADAGGTPPARMPAKKMLVLYGNAFRRGFGAIFGIAWLIGFATARRRLLRADYAVLFFVAGCVAAAAWVHLWYAQATSSRYFLTIVLLALPCSATGWLWGYDRLAHLAARAFQARWVGPAVTVAAIIATALAGVGESLADRHDGRSREAALGRWLLAEFGPASRIATLGPMPLVGFYAQTVTSVVGTNDADFFGPEPDAPVQAIVAVRRGAAAGSVPDFVNAGNERGYRRVDPARLPTGHDWSDVVVLIASAPVPCARPSR